MTLAISSQPAMPSIPARVLSGVYEVARYLVSLSRNIARDRAIYVSIDVRGMDPEVVKELESLFEFLGFRRASGFPGTGVVIRAVDGRLVLEAHIKGVSDVIASIPIHAVPDLVEAVKKISKRLSQKVSTQKEQDQQPPQGQQPSRQTAAPSPQDI
ncbi:MAG: hypothetical protein QXQ96_10475 [Sulfolobales archaeon]